MAYMVAGYLIIWACSFVFILSMVRRQRGVEREIEMLRQTAAEERPQRGAGA